MGLAVTFVSGVRRSGKSRLIRSMTERLYGKVKPHYIRLAKRGGDKVIPCSCRRPNTDCGVATARWIQYEEERVFETLPNVLAGVHREDRYGAVVIEADADPILRHAYPYDNRIFVMPHLDTTESVFRDPASAAQELQRVLADTTSFASEFFGLLTDETLDDQEPHEERADLSGSMMRGFLYSPLGDELATRIQLKPAYHGLVEADVIVVNTSINEENPNGSVCMQRLEAMLTRIQSVSGRQADLFQCDPADIRSRATKQLLKVLKPMCVAGK